MRTEDTGFAGGLFGSVPLAAPVYASPSIFSAPVLAPSTAHLFGPPPRTITRTIIK